MAGESVVPGYPNANQASPVTMTIPNGASGALGPAVIIGAAMLLGIQTPAAIDSATAITFQVSYDGVTYANFYDSSGTEYTVTASTSRSILLSPQDFYGVRGIKVRLGTSGSPATVTADRTFILSTRV